jgi:hypothetical protein
MQVDQQALRVKEQMLQDKRERVRFYNYIRSGIQNGQLLTKADIYVAFVALGKKDLIRPGTIARLADQKPLTAKQMYAFL